LLDEEDLFCANCGAEAPERARDETASRTSTHNFECSGCGASMSYDPRAGGLRCPFCGSVEMEAKPDRKVLAPRRIAPFVVERERAVATMRRWLGRGFWRPSDLSERALVVKMTPVYVPYWVFEATTHTYWTADTNEVPWGASGDWRPLAGEHRGRHSGLLVGASGALEPGETAALCPFDLGAAVPAEQVDLEPVIVEPFSLARKYARPRARAFIESLEAQDCQTRYVPGTARNVRVSVLVSGQTSEPVLLPVWIMAYRYRARVYRFLVNGQTGKAAGRAPISWMKVALAATAVVLVAAVILVLALGR
jgi:DNA-directed RNA polymerase subunit RPC12/RpoP